MTLLAEKDTLALRRVLEKRLRAPVTIDYFTRTESSLIVPGRECEACDETERLLEEVAGLSDRIRLEVHDFFADDDLAATMRVDRIPAIVLSGGARGRVRYFGIPAGYEFGSFVEELIDVANGTTDLAPATRSALQGLARDVHIQVFVTPACLFCPAAARLAHKMAVESDKVTADVVEATEFPDLVERYKVHGVPKVVVNETVEFTGAQPETRFVGSVLQAVA
jgi:glutaredoxin-like protein